MEQGKKKSSALLLLLLLLGGAVLAFRSKGGTTPPPGGGLATPGGSVGSVDVGQGGSAGVRVGLSQRGGHGRMNSHLVVKRIGDTVALTVTWTAATKDFAGQPIPWNYGISWRLISTTKAGLVNLGFFNIGSRPNGSFSFGTSFVLTPGTFDPTFWLGSWTMQVALHADNSSPTGQPLGDMPALGDNALVIGFGEHVNAFRVV